MANLLDPKKAVVAQIAAALTKLGDTPDKIAETLLADQCYGHRKECRSCPVAMYIARIAPMGSSVMVLDDKAIVTSPSSRASISVDLPAPVKEFLALFDDKTKYTELDADELIMTKLWDDASWFKAWDGIIDPLGGKP